MKYIKQDKKKEKVYQELESFKELNVFRGLGPLLQAMMLERKLTKKKRLLSHL